MLKAIMENSFVLKFLGLWIISQVSTTRAAYPGKTYFSQIPNKRLFIQKTKKSNCFVKHLTFHTSISWESKWY